MSQTDFIQDVADTLCLARCILILESTTKTKIGWKIDLKHIQQSKSNLTSKIISI